MSGRAVQGLARAPVIGYFLKVLHDFVKLPVLRADLHRENQQLASRVSEQAESLANLKAGMAAQKAALATSQAQTDRQKTFCTMASERLDLLEAHDAAIREQIDTLLQRVSDNLAEWIELRHRLAALQGEAARRDQRLDEAATRLDQLQTKVEEGSAHARVEETAAKLQDLQTQVNTQEEAFAGVLRRQARTLAELREAIAGTGQSAAGITRILDSINGMLAGRRPGETVAPPNGPIPEPAPELPRRFQPVVKLLLGETVRGDRFCFRVAAAQGRDADLIADFSELPFASAGVAEIHAGPVLESATAKEARRLLSHWSNLLWDGGALHMTFTDLDAAERTYAHVSSAFGELSRAILGQRGERRKAFNWDTVQTLLRELGFDAITRQPMQDPAADGFRFEIHAIRSTAGRGMQGT